MSFAKNQVEKFLNRAGITINGSKPYDMQVLNDNLYQRILAKGSLGLGEAYMDGWWEVKNLDEFFYKVLDADLDQASTFKWKFLLHSLHAVVNNLQSKKRAFIVGEQHYDIGNDLYEAMLDKTMTYSCAYWKNAKTLDQAQEAKLDLICRKLGLEQGDRILDIGCGWGGLLRHAAQNYGVKGLGVTVSKEQASLAKKNSRKLRVDFTIEDYRDLKGQFDHIVSVGMFEHVGPKNYRTYFKKAAQLLKDDGLFLLHTIGGNKKAVAGNPWIEKYIFPNGVIPAVSQISTAFEGLFIMEDWHNFGAYYDKTLMAWFENFEKHWPRLRKSYDDRFYRMWKYYLLSCAGAFRARKLQLWQIVLSKKGLPGGYQSVR